MLGVLHGVLEQPQDNLLLPPLAAQCRAAHAHALILGERPLTLADVVAVARGRQRVAPLPMVAHGQNPALDRLHASAAWVQTRAAEVARAQEGGPAPAAYYGINTGFGSLAGKQAFARVEDLAELSRRLILSNAAGVGPYLAEEVVRAAMLIRASSLAQGYSGVRAEMINTLLAMLNHDLYPAIPEMGSLGASGDLIPLAHLFLVMTCPSDNADLDLAEESGEAFIADTARPGHLRKVSGKEAMALAGIARIALGAKEGLSAVNGTSFSTALVALALADAENLLLTSEIALAMSAEAVAGFRDAFLPPVHLARGHPGQIDSAANIYALLHGSRLLDGDLDRDPQRQPPQDAYSFRCAPQVLGPIRDTLRFVRQIVETEINAATDNPLIFLDLPPARRLKAVSGGNFHAEYLAFAADFLSIAVTELANIAERRIFRLTDHSLSRGLPDMLIDSFQIGLDCGFMLPHWPPRWSPAARPSPIPTASTPSPALPTRRITSAWP